MHIKDRDFDLFLPEKDIQNKILQLAEYINRDFQHRNPLFVGVLNGAFMFAADLMKNITIASELTFIKVKSYAGTQSTGQINTLIGLEDNIENRHIIILEDIVDTGYTIQYIKKYLEPASPASVEIATLLFKPSALLVPLDIKYTGFEIPTQFVVGYGLDYDGQGRNLRDIYRLTEETKA